MNRRTVLFAASAALFSTFACARLGFVNDPVFGKLGPGVVENLLAWLQGKALPRPLIP